MWPEDDERHLDTQSQRLFQIEIQPARPQLDFGEVCMLMIAVVPASQNSVDTFPIPRLSLPIARIPNFHAPNPKFPPCWDLGKSCGPGVRGDGNREMCTLDQKGTPLKFISRLYKKWTTGDSKCWERYLFLFERDLCCHRNAFDHEETNIKA